MAQAQRVPFVAAPRHPAAGQAAAVNPWASAARGAGPPVLAGSVPTASAAPRRGDGDAGAQARLLSYTPLAATPGRSPGPRGLTPQHIEEAARTPVAVPQFVEEEKYGAGVEVVIGDHRFQCVDVLGSGSYSEVWRARVLGGAQGPDEVALKEVRCSSQAELQQAIFEVQVLLALNRSAPTCAGEPVPRVPRCITYKVEPCSSGWKVRTAMTVVPGESLDVFVRRPVAPNSTRANAVSRGCALAAQLVVQLGPTLERLAPIAWHRDVNSHNIIVDNVPDNPSVNEVLRATYQLIDFGLAVDSQSWVTSHGRWRTEDIGGDSRYWPPSSWIMHLLGPEGFTGRKALCEQYQTRLDIHGLGITALELICSAALEAPSHDDHDDVSAEAWDVVLHSWVRYRDDVWRWWSAVYSVFSTGGDIVPVQQQLVKDRVIEQLITLLQNIRRSLRLCAEQLQDDRIGLVLRVIADMIDEGSVMSFGDASAVMSEVLEKWLEPDPPDSLSAGSRRRRRSSRGHLNEECLEPLFPRRSGGLHGPPPKQQAASPVAVFSAGSPAMASQADQAGHVQGPVSARASATARHTPPGSSSSQQAAAQRTPLRDYVHPSLSNSTSPLAPLNAPMSLRSVSPVRGLSPALRTISPVRSQIFSGAPPNSSSAADFQLRHSRSSLGAPSSNLLGEAGRRRYNTVSVPPDGRIRTARSSTGDVAQGSQTSIGRVQSVERGLRHNVSRGASVEPTARNVFRSPSMDLASGGGALRHPSVERTLPVLGPRGAGIEPGPLQHQMNQAAWSNVRVLTSGHHRGVSPHNGADLGVPSHRSAHGGSNGPLRAVSAGGDAPEGFLLRPTARSPSTAHRQLTGDVRGPPSWSSGALLRGPSIERFGTPSVTGVQDFTTPSSLRSPRTSAARSGSVTGLASASTGSLWPLPAEATLGGASTGRSMSSRMLPSARDIGQALRATSPNVGSMMSQGAGAVGLGGDGDLGAGPPYPMLPRGRSDVSAPMMGTVFASAETASGVPSADRARVDLRNQEVLRHHIQNLDANGDEHEKLRERIKTLEESLKRLGRESLERAKIGMERLAEKYDPGGQLQPSASPGRQCDVLAQVQMASMAVEAQGFFNAPGALQAQQPQAPAIGYAVS